MLSRQLRKGSFFLFCGSEDICWGLATLKTSRNQPVPQDGQEIWWVLYCTLYEYFKNAYMVDLIISQSPPQKIPLNFYPVHVLSFTEKESGNL